VLAQSLIALILLDQHDAFMGFPPHNSKDFERARRYGAKASTCPEWQNGVLAVDGTTVDLYATPGFFYQAFYDRKSKYSLGCQVCFFNHLKKFLWLICSKIQGSYYASQSSHC
jgi:hypothetical protein